MEKKITQFPTSVKELDVLGWKNVDVVLFTGDAFIDHPAFGAAVIARVLERGGYRVAVVPQPNWRDDLRDFKKMGEPRLFFAVTSGAMDSMVNHYTAAKRLRSTDAYTPGGKSGMRPDYAVKTYTDILRKLYPSVPIVIGGIEASLRRVTHYDYWQDTLLPSILAQTPADLLIYGMGEKTVLDVAAFIKRNRRVIHGGMDLLKNRELAVQLLAMNQVAYKSVIPPKQALTEETENEDFKLLPSFDRCKKDKKSFIDGFNIVETEANKMHPVRLVEPVGTQYIYINPANPIPSTAEIDSYHDLPFTKLPHPRYKGKHIPAYEMIKFSVNTHRGCFGGCSFCTIAAHQGKHIQSRSEESILKEIAQLHELPDFAGNISDLGGPTANMYGMKGNDESVCEKCYRKSCLFPKMCPNLNNSHRRLLKLYAEVDKVNGIRNAYIGSGIRYDLFLDAKGFLDSSSKPYFTELVLKHTSGRLKVAPEHTEQNVLRLMNKPSFALFERLRREFDTLTRQKGVRMQIIPYFISSHPGCSIKDMERLANTPSLKGICTEQVQDFTPTPMTKSSVMYYTEMDTKTFERVFVEKNMQKKQVQKSYFFKK